MGGGGEKGKGGQGKGRFVEIESGLGGAERYDSTGRKVCILYIIYITIFCKDIVSEPCYGEPNTGYSKGRERSC